MKAPARAHLALLGTNIFFAINYSAIKHLISEGFVLPFGLNLIRVFVCAMLLWILFLFKKEKKAVRKKDLGRFFLCALTGIAVNQLLFVKGLSMTYSIHASLLMLATPIIITIIAAWLLKEKLTIFKLAGLLLGVSGAMVLILSREATGKPSEVLLGDILIILNAISYGFYFILVKPLMKDYEPVAILRIVFTIGFFLMLPFCFREFTATPWITYGLQEYGLLAVIVLGGTFLAYIFNVYGIKILGASVAGTYIYSQPLFTAAIAAVFLGESISAYKIFAGLLIFAGVYLANKTKKND